MVSVISSSKYPVYEYVRLNFFQTVFLRIGQISCVFRHVPLALNFPKRCYGNFSGSGFSGSVES